MLGGLGFEFVGSFMPDAKLTAFENLAMTNPIVSNNLARSSPRVNSYMFEPGYGAPVRTELNLAAVRLGRLRHVPHQRRSCGSHSARCRSRFRSRSSRFRLRTAFRLGRIRSRIFSRTIQFGGNVGLGVFGFFDQVGFRADVRYYTGIANNEGDNLRFVAQNVKDIAFWRSTAGVSFRW